MEIRTLGEVCEVIAGQSPPSTSYNYDREGLPFFQGKADFGVLYPTARVWCTEPLKIAQPNDILISVRAPVGPTNLCQTKACIGRGLSAIRTHAGADFKYVLYYLRAIEPRLSRQGRGSTFSAITQDEIRSLTVPLPSIPIQKRIASILEKADAAREKRIQANELTEQFLQAAFLEMFGDPVTNPKEWKKIPLVNLCADNTDLRCGPFGSQLKKLHYEDTGVPVWDIEDVKDDFENPARYHVSPAKAEELSNYYLQPGDIVMTRRATIGISSVYPSNAGRGIMHSALLRIRVDQTKVNPVFLSNQLSRSKDVEDQISRFSSGAIFESINVSKLKAVCVLVPPKAEQERFAALVKKIESLCAKQKESEIELDGLFNSLMQKAFKGELVKDTVSVAVPRRVTLSPTDLHLAILGKIIMAHEAHPEHKSTLGHVKGEKICHIVENFLEIDLGRNPRRMAAGPADFPHLLKVESRCPRCTATQSSCRSTGCWARGP